MLLPLFCREISHIPNEILPLSTIFSSLSPNCLHVIAKKQQVELPNVNWKANDSALVCGNSLQR